MKGRERMKNCIWLLQKSAKACPQRLPAMLLVTLLDAVNAVNIILFYKYAVQALYQEEVLKQMAIVVGIYLAVHVIHSVVNNYLTQVKYPVWNETIKQSLSKEIYEQYNLTERVCEDNDKVFLDVLIYRNGYKLSELDSAFITEVCNSKRKYLTV